MKNYAGIEDIYAQYDTASVLLQSIPYDGTSTWGKGADNGFEEFLEAAENMELYDIETNSEVYKNGVFILPPLTEKSSPEAVFAAVYDNTKTLLNTDKFLTFFGGEHSISIGIIKAYYERFKDLTVLQLDAHADLRESYLGSKYNHACALHDASINTNLIQVGIRSMDISEKEFLNPRKCYFAHQMYDNEEWMEKSIRKMTEDVYITLDLDVLDPAIMPATGTPEPGGLEYNTILKYLKQVFLNRNVVGFDINEFAPLKGLKAPQFLVSKLYYKMLSYKFKYK
jgi:agmatinase